MKSRATERIVARINELAWQKVEVTVPQGSILAEPTKPVKQLKTFRPASLAPNRVLETPEEVETYLSSLRSALLRELETGHKLRLE